MKSFETKKTNNIYKALTQFGNSISPRDINVIISLRNSLAHNYGLTNIPKNSKENTTKRHKFILDNSDTCDVAIKYPNKIWEGSFTDKSEKTSTNICISGLIDLVENVYINLLKEINKRNVELGLAKGIEELKARFTIRF